MPGSSPQPKVSFGTFEVNPQAGELRKQGIRVKLHDKPLQVLLTFSNILGKSLPGSSFRSGYGLEIRLSSLKTA